MRRSNKSLSATTYKPYSAFPVQEKNRFSYCPISKETYFSDRKNITDGGTGLRSTIKPKIDGPSPTIDYTSKAQQVVSATKDTLSLLTDSTEITTKLSRVRETGSQLKMAVEVVHIREVTQLITFLDDFTAIILTRVRDLKMISISTNAEEVLQSIQELNSMLDSRLKQFGEKLADAITWIGGRNKSLPLRIAKRWGDIEQKTIGLLTKVPKIQSLLKGTWLGVLGLGVSLLQIKERKKTYLDDPASEEKWNKYVIEVIGFFVGVALLIIGVVAVFLTSTVSLVIAIILILYGLVNLIAGFYDHQDLLSEAIYYSPDAYRWITELFSDLERVVIGWYNQAEQAISNLWTSLKSLPTDLADATLEYINNSLANMISSFLTPKFYY